MEKITKQQLRQKIEGVMFIMVNASAGDIWLALQKKYPYTMIVKIMAEIESEKTTQLHNMGSDIDIVDASGRSIEMVIEDGEKKKKKAEQTANRSEA